jgi:hypothetical protein
MTRSVRDAVVSAVEKMTCSTVGEKQSMMIEEIVTAFEIRENVDVIRRVDSFLLIQPSAHPVSLRDCQAPHICFFTAMEHCIF